MDAAAGDISHHVTIDFPADGVIGVQHFGPEHIVPGSEQVFEVPTGTTVTIRYLHPAEGTRDGQ